MSAEMAAEMAGRRWWRRRSLRARLTLATVLVLALALGAGIAVILRLSQQATVAGVENVARPRVTAIARVAGHVGRIEVLVQQVPRANLHLPGYGGQLLQVVNDRGQVVIGFGGAKTPLLDAEQVARARRGEPVTMSDPDLGRAVSVGAPVQRTGGDPLTVLMTVPIGGVAESMDFVRLTAFAGAPLLLLFVGGLVWIVLGSALRPVTALRRGAEDIVGHAPGRRLPVPDAQDEIHDLAVTLNDMLDRLAYASARQRAFTADAAHELRSPLASVRAQLEVALAHPNGQRWPDTARDVLTDIRRLTGLSEDLLALSRLDAAPSPSDATARTDVAAVAATVAERFDNARVPVAVVVRATPMAAAPPHDVDRVLTNLVANAVRHAGSQVTVAVAAWPGEAVLTVADDGPGIPPQDRLRVFERFTRLDDARDHDAGGAGLGLAIVAETVKRYHGHVILDDACPGLRATIRLPS